MSNSTYFLDKYTSISFFGKKTSTYDIVELLLNTISFIRQNQGFEDTGNGYVKLVDMESSSRLFFFQEKKYFSIVLPFTYREEDENLVFFYNSVEIDPTFTSALQSLLRYASGDVIAGIEDFDGEIDAVNDGLVNPGQLNLIYRYLLSEEYGYLRYDHDPLLANGETHPLDHIDVNYTNRATYKLGLVNEVNEKKFIDIIDSMTECWYLKKCEGN